MTRSAAPHEGKRGESSSLLPGGQGVVSALLPIFPPRPEDHIHGVRLAKNNHPSIAALRHRPAQTWRERRAPRRRVLSSE
jgi:hypothetical protein